MLWEWQSIWQSNLKTNNLTIKKELFQLYTICTIIEIIYSYVLQHTELQNDCSKESILSHLTFWSFAVHANNSITAMIKMLKIACRITYMEVTGENFKVYYMHFDLCYANGK